MDRAKEAHPRAYEPWSDEEDKNLAIGFAKEQTVDQLAATHQRQPGAIRSRLNKFGL